jgi:hypothetical protein
MTIVVFCIVTLFSPEECITPIFNPEDERAMILQNVCNHLQNYMVSQPRRSQLISSPQREQKISDILTKFPMFKRYKNNWIPALPQIDKLHTPIIISQIKSIQIMDFLTIINKFWTNLKNN